MNVFYVWAHDSLGKMNISLGKMNNIQNVIDKTLGKMNDS